MAMPILSKNWVFANNIGGSNLNQTLVLTGADNIVRAKLLLYFKKSLCSFLTGAWTVIQSRNGNGTWGATDTWIDETSMGTLTSNPWIVLQNTFGGNVTQILISVNNAYYCSGKSWVSTGTLFPASVGGNPPTIPSDAMKWTGDQYTNDVDFFDGTAGTYRMHVMQTWDAGGQGVECLRMLTYKAGTCYAWTFLDVLQDVSSEGVSWNYPYVGCYIGRGSAYAPAWDRISINSGTEQRSHSIYGTTRFMISATTDSNDGTNVVFFNSGAVNSLANAYTLCPVGYCAFTEGGTSDNNRTPPLIGVLGELADFWLGSQALATLTTYPSNPALPELVQWGHFVWPWDPSVGAPLTT